MNISVKDERGSGILGHFAEAVGTTIEGRFLYIPESKGAGYLTGFAWGAELRMMIRNYYLKEDVSIKWENASVQEHEPVVFLFSGVFADVTSDISALSSEQASVLICRQSVTSFIDMPSRTAFRSITIAASSAYLRQLFGHLDHPVVQSLLEAKKNFAYETGLSRPMLEVAESMRLLPVPESLASPFYRSKCEEMICYVLSLLIERTRTPTSRIHIDDIKSLYAIKARLQIHLDSAPDIPALAQEAGMSGPKLRRLFRQMFGTGVFEYYQTIRMQEAAKLLRHEKLTVSEVGYRLGFINLSHFSRVFEQHYGMKPKRYSAGEG